MVVSLVMVLGTGQGGVRNESKGMSEYKSDFTIEDFDKAVREFEGQAPCAGGVIIIGSQDQIDAYYEKDFWPAMERAAIAYLNSRGR